MMNRVRRISRLLSQMLCLASLPVILLAFYDPFFDPLNIKEALLEGMGFLTFLLWWISRGAANDENLRVIPNPLARPLWYLCFFALLSITWSSSRPVALQHWISYLALMLYLPPLFEFGTSNAFFRKLSTVLVGSLVILIFLAVLQINGFSLDGLLRVSGGNTRTRVSVTIGHNNGVAPMVLSLSFLVLALLFRSKDWLYCSIWLLLAFLSWIILILYLLTRSSILGLLAGVLVLIVLAAWYLIRQQWTQMSSTSRKGIIWGLTISCLLVVCLVVVAGYFAFRGGSIEGEYNPNSARNIIDRLRTFNPNFLLVDSRARLWAVGLTMIRSHPLLGVGFSGSKFDYPLYQASFYEKYPDFPAGPTNKQAERLHNDYLQCFVELGLIGMLLLLWAMVVFFLTIRIWLRNSKGTPFNLFLSNTCVLIMLLTLLLDGVFSFPAHIAPLALFFPFLLMLWMRIVYPRFDSAKFKGWADNLNLWWRLVLASVLWIVIFWPVGMTEKHPPLLTRAGLFTPVVTKVYAETWQQRLMSYWNNLIERLANVEKAFAKKEKISLQEISNLAQISSLMRERYLKMVSLYPHSGELVFDAAVCFHDLHQFYRVNHDPLYRFVRSEARNLDEIKPVLNEVSAAPEFLKIAANLYKQSLENYQFQGVYLRYGLALWGLAGLPELTDEQRSSLIQSARKSLETARRIFREDERVFQELDLALRAGDLEGASLLGKKLLDESPFYLRDVVIPRIGETRIEVDPRTSRKIMDPLAVDLFRVLLPHYRDYHTSILMSAMALLARGGATDLARAYAQKVVDFQGKIDGSLPYYYLVADRRELESLDEELALYDQKLNDEKSLFPIQRISYLMDLQRFAPTTTDFTQWRQRVQQLEAVPDQIMTLVFARQSLATEAYNRYQLQEVWRLRNEALAGTSVNWQRYLQTRAMAALDVQLYGIFGPLLTN